MLPQRVRNFGVIVLVLLAALPLLTAVPSLLRVGSIFFLAVVILAGLHIITGLTKVISLCHAALVGVGAYGSAIITLRLEISPFWGILVGAGAGALVALLLAWVTRHLEEHYLALATLAAAEIITNIFRGSTELTGGANGLANIPPLVLFGLVLDTPGKYYLLCALTGVASLLFVRMLDRRPIGRSLRAMGDEGTLIEALGVSVFRLRAVGFAAGGALAGVGGAISAHIDGFVGPESFGVGLSIAYLCFLVIGGLGRLSGIIIGAVLASLGPELLRGFYEWQMILVAALSLSLLVVRGERHQRKLVSRLTKLIRRGVDEVAA